jgi:hypothetical protein
MVQDSTIGKPDGRRAQAIRNRALQMPQSRRGIYLRSAAGTAPPRTAIKAFCLECMGWQREEVRLCTATACPLWLYRPYRGQAPVE